MQRAFCTGVRICAGEGIQRAHLLAGCEAERVTRKRIGAAPGGSWRQSRR